MVCETGVLPTWIVTVLLLEGQLPFVIVHWKVLFPLLNPLTEVLAELELVKLPVPLTTDHVPVPADGVLPERLAVVPVMYWSVPALAVGVAFTVTAMVALGPSHALTVCDT